LAQKWVGGKGKCAFLAETGNSQIYNYATLWGYDKFMKKYNFLVFFLENDYVKYYNNIYIKFERIKINTHKSIFNENVNAHFYYKKGVIYRR
jgi:hypothetical protein